MLTMHKIILLGLSFLWACTVSAQKAKVRLTYKNSMHNLTLSEENMRKTQTAREPFVLYTGYTGTPFHEAYINWRKNTFLIKASLTLPEEEDDTTHVNVGLNLKNLTREDSHWLCFLNMSERIKVTLQNGRGQSKAEIPICCLPPLASRGKELYLSVKVRIDMRNEDGCVLAYTVKEKKRKKPLMLSEWPSEEEFKSRIWYKYLDDDGKYMHEIYLDGLNIARPVKNAPTNSIPRSSQFKRVK